MKRTHLLFLLLWSMFFVLSCSSVHNLEIETYNPAKITFPEEVKTVLIVNNSAQQPDSIGHRYLVNNKEENGLSVPSDSAAYDLCISLGEAIAMSPLFRDVRMCEDTLRRDAAFYESQAFSPEDIKLFCEDYEVDAVISLDELGFVTKLEEYKMGNIITESGIEVIASGVLRTFWPGIKEPYTFTFSDSLKWLEEGERTVYDTSAALSEKDVADAMRYLSAFIGNKMRVNFVPFWYNDNRWYYTNITSEWKRGTACAASGEWKEAASIWESMLAKEKKWTVRARLLSNIALSHELSGEFDKAVDFAGQSYRLFEENAGPDNAYTKAQKIYFEVLQKRREADSILSKQLNENN